MQNPNDTAARWFVEPGYHDLMGTWHASTPGARDAVTAALRRCQNMPADMPPGHPTVAYQCGSNRMWGLAIQLYALRSEHNWGHGDFGDLNALVDIAAKAGICAIGLNPLHALFPERADDASPYAPNSRLFLNPLYIDMRAIPEFPGLAALGLEAEVAALRAMPMVAYRRIARAKLEALHASYLRFRSNADTQRSRDFESFCAERGEQLVRFTAFEVLRLRFGTGAWWDWPESWRQPTPESLAQLRETEADALDFHAYLQWNAERQLRGCQQTAREGGMPIGLYVDLAVGVDPGGADAWSGQGDLLAGISVGAPPDQFNAKGQDWGLTTFNPHALIAKNFEPMRAMLREAMQHAGAVRLDHVLGLMRLYLIPWGFDGAHGVYVRFPFEALLSLIAEESARAKCVVIGEDLGTVPEGFREKLAQWGLWSYSVMMFEREHHGGFRAPDSYIANALATFNTHDLPTFAGWMAGHDIALKQSIGLDPGETEHIRAQSHTLLRAALTQHAEGEDFTAVARYLARTPARIVMIALEDILGVAEQTNVPGTLDQHPNWRRRIPVSLEQIAEHGDLKKIAAVFAQAGRSGSS